VSVAAPAIPAFISTLAGRAELQGAPAWLGALRAQAMARFEKVGFPTPKLEDWKYTNLAPLGRVPFAAAGEAGITRAHVEALANAWDGPQLVFVNGRLSSALSSWTPPRGLSMTPFAQALERGDATLESHLGRHVSLDQQPLAALNTALASDGALLEVAEGAKAGLVHLVFLTGANAPVAAFPRVLILASAGSELAVLQTFVGSGGERSFTSAVTEVELGEGTSVTAYTLQRQPDAAAHVGLIQVSQARGSRFSSVSLALGAALARDEVRVRLDGEGASCSLSGLYVGTGTQHLDQHTLIDHAKPSCTSRELYKGLLDDQSHGVFTGRVVVREDAQKTDSAQTNKNLLLSNAAQVDTRPQLEILADDVKCTHGSAVGQIDEDELFYLRSRGIDLLSARGLLTWAFASEVLDAIAHPALQLRARELVAGRLRRMLP
jgi:Fe-S cluster assembly protein SufD